MTALDGPHLARAHPLESAGHRSRATGPERARAAAGFDHFCLGALDKSAIDFLAERLTAGGEIHDGVRWAANGWIRPGLCST